MKIYYAHSMRIYNSKRERDEVRCLCLRRHIVINPNGLLDRYTWKQQARRYIAGSDAVVVSEYLGYIGKGAHWEIELAMEMSKPVFVLRDRQLTPVIQGDVEIVNKYDWKIRYARIAA